MTINCEQVPTFNDKADYLTWRADWRLGYRALSQLIRDLKSDAKQARRNANCTGCHDSLVRDAKFKATRAIELRRMSKQRAASLWQAANPQILVKHAAA